MSISSPHDTITADARPSIEQTVQTDTAMESEPSLIQPSDDDSESSRLLLLVVS